MKKIFTLQNFNVKNKTIFLRLDLNVPLCNKKIIDNSKIVLSLPTIKYLLKQNCKIIIATHLGKPKGKIVKELKTDLLVKELKKYLIKIKITKLNDCIGKKVRSEIKKGKKKQIFLLENLRFYKEEEENDLAFAHCLANLADIYVNDAFAVCHRNHASVTKITNFLPSLSGFLLEKEMNYLNQTLKPKKPTIWIMGGAKLEKINLIKQALKKADYILVGGALVFSFLKAKRIKVGMSKVDLNSVKLARQILNTKKYAKKIIYPLDFIVTEKFSPKAKTKIVEFNQIGSNQIALDLGPLTIKLFKNYLLNAKTIVWNGPLGYFEWTAFAQSTKKIGRFLSEINAFKIAGGGETVEAINKFYLRNNFTYVSTGGGATLQFLAMMRMPGLDALEQNFKKFNKSFPLT